MLVELGLVEQRYRAVLEVLNDGATVTDVARRYGVVRQTVYRWLRRYATAGLAGLADASSKPASCPHQMSPEVEARIVEWRRAHPTWGPRTIVNRLARENTVPLPGRSSVYRALIRHGLIDPKKRRRRPSLWAIRKSSSASAPRARWETSRSYEATYARDDMTTSASTTPTGPSTDEAARIFSLSILISAVRCLLTYVVFPWVLPLLGHASGVGPAIAVVVGAVAIVANVVSIRRFRSSTHVWRRPVIALNSAVIVLLVILVIIDIGELVS